MSKKSRRHKRRSDNFFSPQRTDTSISSQIIKQSILLIREQMHKVTLKARSIYVNLYWTMCQCNSATTRLKKPSCALEIDPYYALARNNLEKLPVVKRAGGPLGITLKDLSDQIDIKQSLTFYNTADGGNPSVYGKVESDGNTITKTRAPMGKLSPHYRFFLNHYKDERFTTCPRCGYKSRLRKFSLFILVVPEQSIVLDKICRYCFHCELIIVHQDQLEEQLIAFLSTFDPDIIGNDYMVIGTLHQDLRKRKSYNQLPVIEMLGDLHDFKEVVTYVPA